MTIEELQNNYAVNDESQGFVMENDGAAPTDGEQPTAPTTEGTEGVHQEEEGNPTPQNDNGTDGSTNGTDGNVQYTNGNTYEGAMEFAKAQDDLRAISDENAMLKAEIERLKQTNVQNAQEINQNVAQTLSGSDEKPIFNDMEYAFATEEERREMMNSYTDSVINYAISKAKSEMSERMNPVISEYEANARAMEFDKAIEDLKGEGGFEDIDGYTDDIRRISEREEFSSLKPYQKVTLAALISRGMKQSPANNVSPDLGAEADRIYANPELMKEIELRKARSIEQNAKSFPAQSASGGIAGAVYQPPKKAQSIEELKAMYGGY